MEVDSVRRLVILLLAAMPLPAWGQEIEPHPPAGAALLSPLQLLEFAEAARSRGDVATAQAAYEALATNRNPAIRNEARFRLAMLHAEAGQLTVAATLLRAILDEQPQAQRVRLELARVLERMGDEAGALRLLRAAQAGGLPPDVARMVDRYSAALRSRKPFGATLELAIAPDSNVNRATRSDTLGTVLGDFVIDEEARPRSGVGLATRGQLYARQRLSESINLVERLSGSADLYREGQFNDVNVGLLAGSEARLGRDRISLEAGPTWRWYGTKPYSRSWMFVANYTHPLDRRSQLRGTASLGLVDNRINDLLDGRSFSASASYERALSERTGIGATLSIERQSLVDPAYSLTGAQLSLFGYHEAGPVTLVATATHGRLVADDRLALLPERRSDRLYRLSLGATLRNLQLGGFAPLVRLTAERNRSTVEIYDYNRFRVEFGVTRAF